MNADDRIVYFNLSVDCEATQPAVNDTALGERATGGLADILEKENWRGTFFVVPGDLQAHKRMYRDLRGREHEIGLHLHPACDGHDEFLGVYSRQTQVQIVAEAADRFAQIMGSAPRAFCTGYASANDHTYPVLVKLGFRHGTCSIPGRILPECASVWAGAPLFMHYAHRDNRLLAGNLDFVEIPSTIDWESRLWGGRHPQDLRIELVDAKNHFYTIHKSVRRQIDEAVPVRLIHAYTHNLFEYGRSDDFRRETLEKVIAHSKRIAGEAACELTGTTLEHVAALYRQRVDRKEARLSLDRRGYQNEEKTG